MSLENGVTAQNYAEKGSDFIERNGGKGWLIVQRSTHAKGKDERKPTPNQWGAWRAYFVGKRIEVRWFDERAYYTVPAEFPHLFDSEATVAADVENGMEFSNRFHARRQRRTVPVDKARVVREAKEDDPLLKEHKL